MGQLLAGPECRPRPSLARRNNTPNHVHTDGLDQQLAATRRVHQGHRRLDGGELGVVALML